MAPLAADLDREQGFPCDIVATMTDLGLMGLTAPETFTLGEREIGDRPARSTARS